MHDGRISSRKRRARKGGPDAPVWVARADLVKQGYEPKTVRLPYRLDEPEDTPMLSAACLRLQDEMLEWSSGHERDPNRFDGTLLSRSRRYQTDEASPFHLNMKHDTRRTGLSTPRLIEKASGQRALAHLKNEDFRRWYNEAKKPKDPSGPERIRRAYGIIKKLRELFAYGIMDELPDCQRLHTVLSQARFRSRFGGASRCSWLSAEAREMGHLSLALATAIQFETALRQRDVIGERMPIPDGGEANGIVINGRRCQNGLTSPRIW